MFPWLAHDAMMHLTAPHGLEQYTGAAWGTRDVCQGSIELLLSLEHDAPAKEILRILFAQQYEESGDWPQWFMLEPYSLFRTGSRMATSSSGRSRRFATMSRPLAISLSSMSSRRGGARTISRGPPADTVDRSYRQADRDGARALHSRHAALIRYGDGDWNDSLQPADPPARLDGSSAWTVALLYEQLRRYAEVLRLARVRPSGRESLTRWQPRCARISMRISFVTDIVAGYGVFRSEGSEPDLLAAPERQANGPRLSRSCR